MGKKRLGVIFGGTSTEHEVSIVSGTSVIKNLNKEKYEIYPIYIDKAGEWFEFEPDNKTYKVGDEIVGTKKIENIWNYLKTMDILFPVLHGLQGEDGTIQGMFELLKIPYVGTRVLGSSVCMDKVYSKIIFEKAKLNQAKYIYIRRFEDKYIYVNEDFSEEILNIQETVNKNKIDVLITVGEEAKNISKIAQKTVKEIYNFEKNEQAIKLLQTYLQKEDAVLIKASNGMNFTEISAQLETVPN